MNGPLRVWICSPSVSAALGSEAGPGSASTIAEGCTEMKAEGASVQQLSTTGKAPAAPKASTRSGAGLSVTTTIAPCRDMTARDRRLMSRNPSQPPLMGRQQHRDKARSCAKRVCYQWVDALLDQRAAQRRAVVCGARQTMSGESIRQRGDAAAAVDIGDQSLQFAQREAIAA